MMTALLTARNILAGERRYDVWAVNQDAEYHEELSAGESSPEGHPEIPIVGAVSAAQLRGRVG